MRHSIHLIAILFLLGTGMASAAEVTLEPVRDATLFESPTGALANGAGDFLFTGFGNAPKRTLLEFDLSGIPAGSTIESVELTLTMSRTIAAGQLHRMHRVTAAWGEGASDAPGPEGTGTNSEVGDATWIHTEFPTTEWATEGGDFVGAESADLVIVGDGDYTFGSTAGLVADVTGWVDDPASNHGWIVLGPENPLFRSAKRFNSRTHPDTATRPSLRIVFTPPPVVAIPTLDPRALAVLALALLAAGTFALRK